MRTTAITCLRVREGPALSARELDCLDLGTLVTSLATQGRWRRVRLDSGKEGWVVKEFLEFAPARAEKSRSEDQGATVTRSEVQTSPNWGLLYLLLGTTAAMSVLSAGAVLKGGRKYNRGKMTVAERKPDSASIEAPLRVGEPSSTNAPSTTAGTETSTLAFLRNALDEKDAEIQRYKRGYDAHLFRRFLYRFIRVDQTVNECSREDGLSVTERDQLSRLLEDALDECGVERFIPPVGADYRTTPGLSDNPKVVPAPDEASAFKIIEVLEHGYRLRHPQGEEVIVPARVRVYGAIGGR